MVNNFHELCFFHRADGLRELVVVHQNQFLVLVVHDVVTGDISCELSVRVRHRVRAVSRL